MVCRSGNGGNNTASASKESPITCRFERGVTGGYGRLPVDREVEVGGWIVDC